MLNISSCLTIYLICRSFKVNRFHKWLVIQFSYLLSDPFTGNHCLVFTFINSLMWVHRSKLKNWENHTMPPDGWQQGVKGFLCEHTSYDVTRFTVTLTVLLYTSDISSRRGTALDVRLNGGIRWSVSKALLHHGKSV